jgi:hypothetical protein
LPVHGAATNNGNFNNWSGTNNHPVGSNIGVEYDSKDFIWNMQEITIVPHTKLHFRQEIQPP